MFSLPAQSSRGSPFKLVRRRSLVDGEQSLVIRDLIALSSGIVSGSNNTNSIILLSSYVFSILILMYLLFGTLLVV